MQKFSSIFSQLLQLFPGYADAIVMKSGWRSSKNEPYQFGS